MSRQSKAINWNLFTNEIIQILLVLSMVRYLLRLLFNFSVRKGQSWNLRSNKTNQTVKSADEGRRIAALATITRLNSTTNYFTYFLFNFRM